MKTLLLVLGAVVLLAGVALGCTGVAYSLGRADESAVKAEASKAALKEQFDLGRKAGQEYEQWFCENPQYDLSQGG